MKKQLLWVCHTLALFLAISTLSFGQTKQSGSDAFGYKWLRSDTIGGTPFSWIDISTTGSKVTGLGDDNVIGPIPIGFDFTYYWNSYNQIYVGSNGYIMFGRGDLIASGLYNGKQGFPIIPTSDAKNNFIAPLLADLTFVSSPGSVPIPNAGVFYQTQGSKFIITYNKVGYWNSAAGGQYSGANTFQVILDNADSSFTIQYNTLSGNADAAYDGNKNSLGFEDVNGINGSSFGVNISNNRLAKKAYKVSYPRQSNFKLLDVAAEGVTDQNNTAAFLIKGSSTNYVTAIVRNSGTVDITSPFKADITFEDANGNILSEDSLTVTSLAKGDRAFLRFGPLPTTAPAGDYLVQISTNLGGDQIDVNNFNAGEAVIVDTSVQKPTFGYDGLYYPPSDNSQLAGTNFGTYYDFSIYPVQVMGTEFDMAWINPPTGYADSSHYRVYFHQADLSGQPGPALDSVEIDLSQRLNGDSIARFIRGKGSIATIRRHQLLLAKPLTVSGQGLFLSVRYVGPTFKFFWNRVMADSIPPYSHRNYEIQGNSWSPDRNSDTQDYALRVIAKPQTGAVLGDKANAKSHSLLYPNPAQESITLQDERLKKAALVSVFNISGQTVFQAPNLEFATGRMQIPTSNLPRGMYWVHISGGGSSQTLRFVKN